MPATTDQPAPRLPSLTITFPCYNEEANVERVTRSAVEVGRRVTDDLEVVIVNDGSKDRTGEIADRLAAEIPGVRVAHNRPNRGYGGALSRGFTEATKDWVFYTDGDGQFDLSELPKLLDLLDTTDPSSKTIVSCFRIKRSDPLKRKMNAWAWGRLVNFLFGFKIRDVDCAFKLYPRTLFQRITMKSTGALIDTEVLAKAVNLGYRVRQMGVNHYPRTAGQQTGAKLSVILRAFRELFGLYHEIKREGRAQRRSPDAAPQDAARDPGHALAR